MPKVKKSLKHRLLNCRYYYTHGLFDLTRRKSGALPTEFTPEVLCTLREEEIREWDTLVLVNREHPVTGDREGLSEMEGFLIAPEAKEAMGLLFDACRAQTGEALQFTDTYRTLDEQGALYGVNPFAVPAGESEHHTGLAADIKTEGFGGRRFLLSKAGRYVAEHAHRFGFVIRYPLWAERKTGIDYEPWHLRYVGIPHAEIMYTQKLILEDYISFFEVGKFYRYRSYILSRQTGEQLAFLPDAASVYVSIDGCGGRILCGEIKEKP